VKHAFLQAVVLSLQSLGVVATLPADGDAGTQSIRGAVTTPSGQPAASVWVVLERNGNPQAKALTADDGRYYLARLPSGPYVIVVRRGEATLYRAQVSLPGAGVHDIVLR
jgi:Carboxypeptidase regulatory-like domain